MEGVSFSVLVTRCFSVALITAENGISVWTCGITHDSFD